MTLLLLTLGAFGFAMLIMAVGVMFKRPCLRGSCGGPEVLNAAGEPLSCATCPNRRKSANKPATKSTSKPAGERLPVLS